MRNVLGASSRGSAEGIGEVASSAVLDSAFAWLCKRRINYADSADVWNVRRHWPDLKPQLQEALLPIRARIIGFATGRGDTPDAAEQTSVTSRRGSCVVCGAAV